MLQEAITPQVVFRPTPRIETWKFSEQAASLPRLMLFLTLLSSSGLSVTGFNWIRSSGSDLLSFGPVCE